MSALWWKDDEKWFFEIGMKRTFWWMNECNLLDGATCVKNWLWMNKWWNPWCSVCVTVLLVEIWRLNDLWKMQMMNVVVCKCNEEIWWGLNLSVMRHMRIYVQCGAKIEMDGIWVNKMEWTYGPKNGLCWNWNGLWSLWCEVCLLKWLCSWTADDDLKDWRCEMWKLWNAAVIEWRMAVGWKLKKLIKSCEMKECDKNLNVEWIEKCCCMMKCWHGYPCYNSCWWYCMSWCIECLRSMKLIVV